MRVVVFTADNARVLYTETPEHWVNTPQAVINPDLKEVTGVEPHYWKLVEGKVLPMTDPERAARRDYHKHTTSLNILPEPQPIVVIPDPEQISLVLVDPPEEKASEALFWILGVCVLVVLCWAVFK